jgi:hypothetical protein
MKGFSFSIIAARDIYAANSAVISSALRDWRDKRIHESGAGLASASADRDGAVCRDIVEGAAVLIVSSEETKDRPRGDARIELYSPTARSFELQPAARSQLDEYKSHAREAGVKRLHTLVAWNDWKLIHFFDSMGFSPAKTITPL